MTRSALALVVGSIAQFGVFSCAPGHAAPLAPGSTSSAPALVEAAPPQEEAELLQTVEAAPIVGHAVPGLGRLSAECSACLQEAGGRCDDKLLACEGAPGCLNFLDCVVGCPPAGARDAKGGYPQADCVMKCRDAHKGADQGDETLWCFCCEGPCVTACSGSCDRHKSGIAGPLGAGCGEG